MSDANERKEQNTLQNFLKQKGSRTDERNTMTIILSQGGVAPMTYRNFGRRPGKLVFTAKPETVRKL